MPQGLEVWDAAGKLLVGLTDRVIKSVIVETVVESGSEVIPYTADSTSTVIAIPLAADEGSPPPSISVGGSSVTVTWGSDGRGESYTRDILIMEF